MKNTEVLILIGLLVLVIIIGIFCLNGSKKENMQHENQNNQPPYDMSNEVQSQQSQEMQQQATQLQGMQPQGMPPQGEPQTSLINQQYKNGGHYGQYVGPSYGASPVSNAVDTRTYGLGVGQGLSQENPAYEYL